jgi:hypothetical protein
MNVKDLELNKWYLVLIDDNLLRGRYDGQFHEYRDNITYYRFFYYRYKEGEFYYRHIKEKDVSKLVQEIPFNYRSLYGGMGGLQRWFNQLTNLLV